MTSAQIVTKLSSPRNEGLNQESSASGSIPINDRTEHFPSNGLDVVEENPLPYLPAVFTVKEGLDLYVSTMASDDIELKKESYKMVKAAAQRGDNIGLDEFQNEKSFMEDLDQGDVFTGIDVRDASLKALIIISPSNYSRSSDPVYADGYIILDSILQKSETYRMMLKISLQFVRDLEYEGCLVNTFSTHTKSILAMRGEGFTIVGSVPYSGFIKGQGWTESMMLFKDLTNDPLKVLPMKAAGTVAGSIRMKQTRALLPATGKSLALTKFIPTKQENANFDSGLTIQSRLSIFPLSYDLCGKKIILNYVQDSECEEVFQLYKSSASQGQGYGEDEFSDLEHFKHSFVDRAHAVIGRDPASGKIVVSFSITPSPYCRSNSPPLADGYMLVDPNVRGKGVGFQVVRIMLALIRKIGYHGALADTFITNKPMYKLMIATGFIPVAYLPKCANVKGEGWTDSVLLYRPLREHLSILAKL